MARILNGMYKGATYVWDDPSQQLLWVSGTDPDFATLAPLTIPGVVYLPEGGNARDTTGFSYNRKAGIVIVFDEANETAITTSLQTVTGIAYHISTLDYISPDY